MQFFRLLPNFITHHGDYILVQRADGHREAAQIMAMERDGKPIRLVSNTQLSGVVLDLEIVDLENPHNYQRTASWCHGDQVVGSWYRNPDPISL